MDIWSPKLHVAVWTVMSLCVFSHEVTVRNFNLMLCEEDDRVCVTEISDCGPRPPSSIQKALNMSCYYESHELHESMTCEWSQESNSHNDSKVSLIFSSKEPIYSCFGIFLPAARLNITARIKNYMTEIWSHPQTVYLYNAIKPSQPVLTLLGSTEDSVVVSWRSSSAGSFRLRYRVNNTHIWTQTPDSLPSNQDQTRYTIKDLLPFTVYRAAVACKESKIWSDWSSEVSARTLDRVPFRLPEVCYRVEKTDSGGSPYLHLMWKDLSDAGSRILGYQVSYKPVKQLQLQDRLIKNVTDVTAHLEVEEGSWNVTVRAFNTAGYGPAAHLSIDTQRQNTVPSVKNLWVSSSLQGLKGLLVQWENTTAQLVSYFAVQWHSETHPSTSRWTTVASFNKSTVIQDVDPDESYLIIVFPVYNQLCGSNQSLPASLQQGALMEANKLEVVGVNKTTVTITWVWQRKSGSIRVNRYTVMLKKDSEQQTLSLWPDQWNHTFINLKPHTEYSLHLLADNVSRSIIPVRTHFDEVPVLATVTPLLLLAVTVLIASILSRTVYKSYFFPPISSPQGSTAGQWLMDPNHEKSAERHTLEIQDFQVTDVLGEKSLIMVGPNSQTSSSKELHEDLIIKLSVLKMDTDYVSDAPVIPEHQLVSVQSSHRPDGEADGAPPHQTCEANSCFPKKEEESRQVDPPARSPQKETAVTLHFHELMANSHCVYQMTCESEYVVSASLLEKPDVETVSRPIECSYLFCESDYIANSCLPAETADEYRTKNSLHAKSMAQMEELE